MSDKKKNAAPEINDPEQLYEYVKIIKPGSWMLLLGTLLIFVVFWFMVTSDELVDGLTCACVCDDGVMTVFLGADNLDAVKQGMEVIIEGTRYHVTDIVAAVPDETDSYYLFVVQASGIDHGEGIYTFDIKTGLPDGLYEAVIVTGKDTLTDYLLGIR